MWSDLSKVESTVSLVPDGTYSVQIEKAEEKKTKDGTGSYVNITLNILGPTQAGRKLFTLFNIENKNPMAAQIGLGQLKQMVSAAGLDISNTRTPDSLLNAIFDVKVGNKVDNFGEKNVIKKYSPSTLNALPKGATKHDDSSAVPF